MQQLFFFLQKYKYFLFFLLLQIIAFTFIFNNHNFHKSKLVSSANSISGGMLNTSSQISDYLKLKTQNNALIEENIKLKNLLEKALIPSDSVFKTTVIDSLNYQQSYTYINAKITQNQYHMPYNFLTINKGMDNGITSEIAVINGKGIIGIIDDVSNNYARVQSILNKNSKINARLKNSFHFGTLTWDGKDVNTVQLTDIPRQAVFKKGDTIITGGMSTIFPEGVLIGTISKLPKVNTASNTLDVKLFNDMTNIGYVYIVKNLHKVELQTIQRQSNE